MRHRAKFSAMRCGDIAVFRFFKMAVVRHLGFVIRLFGPPAKCILVVSFTVQNIGLNRFSSSDNMQVLIF